MNTAPKRTFSGHSQRIGIHGIVAHCKDAQTMPDTDLAGRRDSVNPAALLLAALSACTVEGVGRVTPPLKFQRRGVTVHGHGVRQFLSRKMATSRCGIIIDTHDDQRRPAPLHDNAKKFDTVFNTVAP